MTVDSTAPSPVQPPATDAPKGAFARLIGVLFEPGATFADIARAPTVLVPLIVFLVLGYIGSIIMVPRMDWEAVTAQQAQQMKKQSPNMSDADVERMGKVARAMGTVTSYIAPLLGILMYLVVALVLFGAVRLMGGEGTFKQSFSATLHAYVPLTLFGVILSIVILAQGTIDPTAMATVVKSNPAFLVDMKEQPVLFALLSSFDLFTIWTIVLLVFGFSAVSRLSWAKTAAIVVTLWMVLIMVKLGFAVLTSAQMRA